MVKVEMPRADWEYVMYLLESTVDYGLLSGPILKDISNQVYSQEY